MELCKRSNQSTVKGMNIGLILFLLSIPCGAVGIVTLSTGIEVVIWGDKSELATRIFQIFIGIILTATSPFLFFKSFTIN